MPHDKLEKRCKKNEEKNHIFLDDGKNNKKNSVTLFNSRGDDFVSF